MKNTNQRGGNGKGVIHELMEAMLGGSEGYYYTAPNSVLLAPLSGKGSCVEVASMSKKRMVVYREPDGVSAKLNTSTICELTGGSEINARLNHSNNNSTKLCATHFMQKFGSRSRSARRLRLGLKHIWRMSIRFSRA